MQASGSSQRCEPCPRPRSAWRRRLLFCGLLALAAPGCTELGPAETGITYEGGFGSFLNPTRVPLDTVRATIRASVTTSESGPVHAPGN